MRTMIAAVLISASALGTTPVYADPIPRSFASHDDERAAIQTLLDTYTKAVSEKNQPMFESILLGPDIPFSDVTSAARPDGGASGTRNYAAFMQGVFHGPAFTQRFRDVHIEQDGHLAQVSLVFVNTSQQGSGWG